MQRVGEGRMRWFDVADVVETEVMRREEVDVLVVVVSDEVLEGVNTDEVLD